MDITLVLTLVAVFTSVALLAGSATYVSLERSSPTRKRVKDILRSRDSQRENAVDIFGRGEAVSPALRTLSTFVPKSPKQMGALRRRMAMAGFHETRHVVLYGACEPLGAAAGLVLPLLLFGMQKGLIFGLMGAMVGYVLPSFVLERYIRQRQKEIQNGLPDALDLLIVCIEAGLAIDQALLKSAEELAIAYPALAEELRLVNVECRAGKPRLEAFKNFAARTKVDDVRALVTMLIQTDRFGTSIAQALRTHAEVSRTKRRQRAEERAAKIGVKMVFPLVFFLFPAFYVVVLGAGVIKFVHAIQGGGIGVGGLP
jgi:tight adherence protein C